ncbi:MAG: RES family NAD+ phosphorylase [Oceanicoccus sp.]|uniref:RES family NAD+ phosphorylase n=1 Tax=Oceanicoccus sp. TaxID=2691044 RepID=UPI002629B80F|nr:RES family NAD+ phosphorylase [Oceanicoccus sp.]MCP3907638.1 RES family NAD+ phosphorylase [Oceanicoccus sp.]MDG1772084.1 RES family NAD+ phosphorylase [Oceanicoccus sp.]
MNHAINIWQACKNSFSHQQLSGQLVRVIESQEQVATNHLVENLEEQHLLEQMLEDNKPGHCHAGLHYLLATPFRYPPLKYGSRFGKRSEPSLFYGSKDTPTALAEAAYYRFVFWCGMEVPPPSQKFSTQHTIWGAKYHTAKGAQLHKPPFADYQAELTAADNYQYSQAIGAELRNCHVEAFEFTSARAPLRGVNVALFTPDALACKSPTYQKQLLCDTNSQEVLFYSAVEQAIYRFSFEQFLINEQLPLPAVC